jgi:hypothetical protein
VAKEGCSWKIRLYIVAKCVTGGSWKKLEMGVK